MASREYLRGPRTPALRCGLSDGRINGHDSDQATLISDNGKRGEVTAQNTIGSDACWLEGVECGHVGIHKFFEALLILSDHQLTKADYALQPATLFIVYDIEKVGEVGLLQPLPQALACLFPGQSEPGRR